MGKDSKPEIAQVKTDTTTTSITSASAPIASIGLGGSPAVSNPTGPTLVGTVEMGNATATGSTSISGGGGAAALPAGQPAGIPASAFQFGFGATTVRPPGVPFTAATVPQYLALISPLAPLQNSSCRATASPA